MNRDRHADHRGGLIEPRNRAGLTVRQSAPSGSLSGRPGRALRGELGAQTGDDDSDGGVGPPRGERVRVSAILPDHHGIGGVRAKAELAGIVGDLSGIAALQSGRSIQYTGEHGVIIHYVKCSRALQKRYLDVTEKPRNERPFERVVKKDDETFCW